jgi:hypothetical protein
MMSKICFDDDRNFFMSEEFPIWFSFYEVDFLLNLFFITIESLSP